MTRADSRDSVLEQPAPDRTNCLTSGFQEPMGRVGELIMVLCVGEWDGGGVGD